MVQEDRIRILLTEHPADPAEHLTTAAIEAGGKDNITVVVIGPKAPAAA